jgi:pimeloyl-ACP methyl ester carboxylesterase
MSCGTVVRRPGPVEAQILADLAPTIRARTHVGGGVTLRLLEGGPSPDRPSDTTRPIVLLHGRGHAATTWAPFLRPLAARRRTIAVDLPGFGQSASRAWTGGGAEVGMAFFVDPVEATLRDLALDRPLLVGHSLGGLVALAIALRGHVDPAALVLIDAMGLARTVRTRARLYYRADPERLARWRKPLRLATEVLGGARPSMAEALRSELLEVPGGRRAAARAFAAMCPLLGDVHHLGEAALARVAAPALLVWGARDEAFPLEVAERASRVMRDAALHVVDGGHSPHVERPAEVLAAIEDLLVRLAI